MGRMDLDCLDIHAVVAEPIQVHPAEVVVSDATDDAARLTELGDLVDEDRGSTARKGPYQLQRLAKAMTWLIRHDLHEDLTESHDLEHLYLRLVAQLPLATGSVLIRVRPTDRRSSAVPGGKLLTCRCMRLRGMRNEPSRGCREPSSGT